MFNTRAAVFYQSGFAPSGFRHDKTHAVSFLERPQKHSWKSVYQESS